MNAPQVNDNRITAFVFGAVFNLLAMGFSDPIILYAIKTFVGGLIWLGFQLAANYFAFRIRLKEEALKASEKKYDALEKKEDTKDLQQNN
jgi:hypothetical protein